MLWIKEQSVVSGDDTVTQDTGHGDFRLVVTNRAECLQDTVMQDTGYSGFRLDVAQGSVTGYSDTGYRIRWFQTCCG